MKGYVYQRGTTWSYKVDIGRDPITGKRKQKEKGGFLKEQYAQKALRKILSELDENRYAEPTKNHFHHIWNIGLYITKNV